MIEKISIAKNISMVLALVFCFITFFLVFKKNAQVNKKEKEVRDFIKKSMGKERKLFVREYIEDWLIRKGMGFEYGGKIGYELFILISIFMGIFGGIIAAKLNPTCVPVGVIIGVIMFPFLIHDSDKRDNVRMLPDIERIFSTIYIQNRAGVYLPTTIINCAKNIKHDRLKSAFDSLGAAVIANKDIELELHNFEKKFDNIYLSSLVIIIRQALTTGRAEAMLRDTVSLMDGINETLNMKCEQKTDSHIMMTSMIFYVALLVLCIYMTLFGAGNTLAGL